MEEWKNEIKDYAIYCKEDRQESWTSDIEALDMATYQKMGDLKEYAYDSQKTSFVKTAEIMKALDDVASWDDISNILMENHKYCQHPVGIIAHMMLKYSKHGIEFVKKSLGSTIEMFPELQKEFEEEVAKENEKTL